MKNQENEQLITAMRKIQRFMHNYHSNQHEMISQMSYFALMLIEKKQVSLTIDDVNMHVVKVSDLCEAMEVSKPAVSRAMRDLEEKGYLSRINSRIDRRNVYVALTEKGKTVLQHQKELMEERTNRFATLLGEHDRKELTRILNRIPDIMEQINRESNTKGVKE